jgi:hypothetical protein
MRDRPRNTSIMFHCYFKEYLLEKLLEAAMQYTFVPLDGSSDSKDKKTQEDASTYLLPLTLAAQFRI